MGLKVKTPGIAGTMPGVWKADPSEGVVGPAIVPAAVGPQAGTGTVLKAT